MLRVLLALTTIASPARAEPASTPAAPAEKQGATLTAKQPFDERRQLNVDRAALEAQRTAIQKISKLAQRYAGKYQETGLLLQLAEAHQHAAGLEFRIAHANAKGEPAASTLKNQRIHLQQVIGAITKYLKTAPEDEVAGALLMRAKSYEELGATQNASLDFKKIIARFPGTPQAMASHMSLAEYAIKAALHPQAIAQLEEVERHPESGYFPFALHKLGWSHYNLRHFDKATTYMERHVKYYDAKSELENGLTDGDIAVRESSLSDLALFLGDGHEAEPDAFPITKAYDRLNALESGAYFGALTVKYARVLRTHGIRDSLIAWERLIIDRDAARAESFDVLSTVVEFFHQRRDYKTLAKVLLDYVTIHEKAPPEKELRSKAASQIATVATDLQKVVIKHKDSPELPTVSAALAGAYLAMTRIIPEEDPRVPGAHYNLGETLFEIGKYDEATAEYSWILDRWNRAWKDSKINKAEVQRKRVNARYQAFRRKELAQELTIRARHSGSSELVTREADWVRWVDDLPDGPNRADFAFEAARLFYLRDQPEEALTRMRRFVDRYPEHPKAVAGASLILDTLSKGEEWDLVHDTATQFRAKKWTDKTFEPRLVKIGGDAFLKRLEKSFETAEYSDVQKSAERFLKLYAHDARGEGAILLAAKSAEKAIERGEDASRLEHWLTLHIERYPATEKTATSLQKRARMLQERLEFTQARRDLTQLLELARKGKAKFSESEIRSFRETTLLLSWLDEDFSKIAQLAGQKDFCDGLETTCDQYHALAHLYRRGAAPSEVDPIQKSKTSPELERPIWALAALTHQPALKLSERAELIRVASSRSGKLDPMVRYVLMPALTEQIPKSLKLAREEIKATALKPTESSIMRRIEKIRMIENATTRIMDLPWSRIRATGLDTLASLYGDFTHELSALPVPELSEQEQANYKEMIEKIMLPFEEKGQELRRKAFEVAAENAIEDDTYQTIATQFFNDNPSQAKLMGRDFQADTVRLDLVALADQLTPAIQADTARNTLKVWKASLERKAWGRVAYLGQLARDWKGSDGQAAGLWSAASLWSAGARAEAFSELRSLDLAPEARTRLLVLLVRLHQQTLAKKQLPRLVEEALSAYQKIPEKGSQGDRSVRRFGFMRYVQNNEEAFALAFAAQFGKVSLEDSVHENLLTEAQASGNRAQSSWADQELKAFRDRVPASQIKKGQPKAAPQNTKSRKRR